MSVVEKVARAICCPYAEDCLDNAALPNCRWIEYTDEARAAFIAQLDDMAEPSDGMICAGIAERHSQPVPEAWSLATKNIWQAMLTQYRKEMLS